MLLYRLCLWKSGKLLLALFLLDWLFAASTDATTRKYDLYLIIVGQYHYTGPNSFSFIMIE